MPQSPFYSSAKWRSARAAYLAKNPYCVVCSRLQIKTRATEVDHIIAMAKGGAPFDSKNLRGLCKQHHSQKTILIDGQHSGSGKNLVTTGVDGWPVHVEVPRSVKRDPKKY